MEFDLVSIDGVDYSKVRINVDLKIVIVDDLFKFEEIQVVEGIKIDLDLNCFFVSLVFLLVGDLLWEYFFVLVVCNIVVLIRVKKLVLGQLEMEVVNSNVESLGFVEY